MWLIGLKHCRLNLFALIVLSVVACGGGGVAPTAPSTPPATPTTTEVSSTPTPTLTPPLVQPANTFAPTPTATPSPTAASESTPIPTPTSTPTQPSQVPPDRGGLWTAAVNNPSRATLYLPWLAFRVTPGESPNKDPWRFEGDPLGLLAFECTPQRQENGWELGSCTGLAGLAEGAEVTAFVPLEGDSGFELTLQIEQTTFPPISLTRLPQSHEPTASANVSLIWHEPGDGIHSDIWAADGLVFAPHYSDGLIEILDAKSGQVLGTATVPESDVGEPDFVWDVKASRGLLYAATHLNGLLVFNVAEPAAPKLIGQHRIFVEVQSVENVTNIHNIFLSPNGNFLYAINHSHPQYDLRIIDVSDPASPVEAGQFSIDADVDFSSIAGLNFPHDVNVVEHDNRLIAFLNHLAAGLLILDVTDSASIVVLSSIEWDGILSHSGWPFPLDGKLYYAHAEEGYDRHLTILDVTDLTNPRVVSRFRTRAGLSIHNVEVVDGIAYISYYIDGLRVVDLRTPETPHEIGHYDTVAAEDERGIAQGLWGVRVLDGIVYVSDIETGVYAFQVDLD